MMLNIKIVKLQLVQLSGSNLLFARLIQYILYVHIYTDFRIYTHPWHNQESFRAGEVSWNKDASIKILSATHEKKAPQGKFFA